MENFSLLDDMELYNRLQKAELAERLRTSPEWGLLLEASNRIVDKAVDKFALDTKSDDLVEVIKLQMIIRKYKHGLFREVEMLAQEGEMAFEEAKNRGLVSRNE